MSAMMKVADALHLNSRLPMIASIRASAMMPMVRELDSRTGKVDLLLAAHGIFRSQLTDPYSIVPIGGYLSAYEQAAEIVGDQSLGARIGTTMKPADIGPMGMLFAMAPTIRRAFERLSRFVNALQGATSSEITEKAGTLVWSYGINDPALWPRRQDSEYSLATTCHLVRQCFVSDWQPIEVHFEHPAPADPKPLQRIFRAPVRFGQSANRLIFDRGEADVVHHQEDPALVAMLQRHIADLSGELGMPWTYSERVSALLGLHLGFRDVTMVSLAKELGMAPRTLQRRLAEEGVSLRELLRRYRISRASAYDRTNERNRSRLAHALGYADSTSLWRARRKWNLEG
jgi:AraC-like DNA-binding protein